MASDRCVPGPAASAAGAAAEPRAPRPRRVAEPSRRAIPPAPSYRAAPLLPPRARSEPPAPVRRPPPPAGRRRSAQISPRAMVSTRWSAIGCCGRRDTTQISAEPISAPESGPWSPTVAGGGAPAVLTIALSDRWGNRRPARGSRGADRPAPPQRPGPADWRPRRRLGSRGLGGSAALSGSSAGCRAPRRPSAAGAAGRPPRHRTFGWTLTSGSTLVDCADRTVPTRADASAGGQLGPFRSPGPPSRRRRHHDGRSPRPHADRAERARRRIDPRAASLASRP